MNVALKRLVAIAALVVAIVIGMSLVPGMGGEVAGVAPTPAMSASAAPKPSPAEAMPSPAATASPSPSTPAVATLQATNGARISVTIPAGWTKAGGWALLKTDPSLLAGMGVMFASVDNMLTKPCWGTKELMKPPLGPTVDDLVTGLTHIPGTTAGEPVQGTIAGLDATIVDFTIPADNPCGDVRFYLWQDGPGAYTWAQGGDAYPWAEGGDEVSRTRVFEIGGKRVLLRTLSWGRPSVQAEAEMQAIVDSARILPAY